MVRWNRKHCGAGRARRWRSGWDDRPSNGIGTEPKAPRTLLKRRKVFGRVRGASYATQHRRHPVEPRPGWVARLAEAARRPAPAPERRLALPKAASYYAGQLGRRAWPIPPVGPPPSELRRACTSERPDASDRAGRCPARLDTRPDVGPDRLDTPTTAVERVSRPQRAPSRPSAGPSTSHGNSPTGSDNCGDPDHRGGAEMGHPIGPRSLRQFRSALTLQGGGADGDPSHLTRR